MVCNWKYRFYFNIRVVFLNYKEFILEVRRVGVWFWIELKYRIMKLYNRSVDNLFVRSKFFYNYKLIFYCNFRNLFKKKLVIIRNFKC